MPQQKVLPVTRDRSDDVYHIHLAAFGAPTVDEPVRFADGAAQVFCAYREKYGFGASEMRAECGNIYNGENQLVGRISYNGRIWDAEGNPVEIPSTAGRAALKAAVL